MTFHDLFKSMLNAEKPLKVKRTGKRFNGGNRKANQWARAMRLRMGIEA